MWELPIPYLEVNKERGVIKMKKKYFWTILLAFFGVLNVGSAVLLFSPAKVVVQKKVLSQKWNMLSVVHGDLMHNGSSIKVVKFETSDGIMLEFYSAGQNGVRQIINRVEIPNARDGFFNHRGQAVQLAVVDLDGDGTMELVSPTFNNNMLARLNPYHYSEKEKAFIPFFFRTDYP